MGQKASHLLYEMLYQPPKVEYITTDHPNEKNPYFLM